ncbi:MAG: chromosomal replication initiator protein DnaA [Rhizomicrobium sp.]
MTEALLKNTDWQTVWSKARAALRRDLGVPTFDAWIGKLTLLDHSKGEIRFGAPKPFVRNWISNHYAGRIEKALRAAGGVPASITIVVEQPEAPRIGAALCGTAPRSEQLAPAEVLTLHARPQQAERALSLRAPDPALSFAAFVEGPGNIAALRAARAFVADEADGVSLLVIHGGFGFGKTHLLNATALEAQSRGLRILLLGAEDFMRQFLGALNRRETLGFKEELRAADMLLIDDLQHLCRSSATMAEMLHTLNAYSDLRRKLVIAADKQPALIENITADVRSRLAGGIAIGVDRPDRVTRLAILKSRAEDHRRKRPQSVIPDEALERIADLEDTTPRDLIGFFNNLTIHVGLTQNPLALNQAVNTIVSRGTATRRTSIEDIQRKIADFYKLELRDFQSSQRSRRVARPRQVAMFLARAITERSLPEIGRRFGGRDHTTVLHACRRIAALCDEDPTFRQEIDFLKQVLGGKA